MLSGGPAEVTCTPTCLVGVARAAVRPSARPVELLALGPNRVLAQPAARDSLVSITSLRALIRAGGRVLDRGGVAKPVAATRTLYILRRFCYLFKYYLIKVFDFSIWIMYTVIYRFTFSVSLFVNGSFALFCQFALVQYAVFTARGRCFTARRVGLHV